MASMGRSTSSASLSSFGLPPPNRNRACRSRGKARERRRRPETTDRACARWGHRFSGNFQKRPVSCHPKRTRVQPAPRPGVNGRNAGKSSDHGRLTAVIGGVGEQVRSSALFQVARTASLEARGSAGAQAPCRRWRRNLVTHEFAFRKPHQLSIDNPVVVDGERVGERGAVAADSSFSGHPVHG